MCMFTSRVVWVAVPRVMSFFWVARYEIIYMSITMGWELVFRVSLFVFDWGTEAGCVRGRLYVMLFHQALRSFQDIWNASIDSFQMLKVGMYTLSPLLSHQACSNVPSPHPRDDVVFQNVHFWKHRCLRECFLIVPHELDVHLCKQECGGMLLKACSQQV